MILRSRRPIGSADPNMKTLYIRSSIYPPPTGTFIPTCTDPFSVETSFSFFYLFFRLRHLRQKSVHASIQTVGMALKRVAAHIFVCGRTAAEHKRDQTLTCLFYSLVRVWSLGNYRRCPSLWQKRKRGFFSFLRLWEKHIFYRRLGKHFICKKGKE